MEEEDIDLYGGSDMDSGREEAEEDPQQEDENRASDNKDEAQVVQPKKKKVVKNPQPKLDENRLLGPRGVTALEGYFKDFEMKGKGHEAEDLDLIMGKLQLWTHRLFPKMKFDDALEKIEALGHKKPVQAHVKKIRLGLITQADLEGIIDEEDVDDAFRNAAGPLDDLPAPVDTNAAFDDLLASQCRQSVGSGNVSATPSAPPKSSQMSEELRKKIEENRRKAQEKLQAKRAAAVSGSAANSTVSATQDTTVHHEGTDSNRPDISLENGTREVVSVSDDSVSAQNGEVVVSDSEENKENEVSAKSGMEDMNDESDVEMPVMKRQRRVIVDSDSD